MDEALHEVAVIAAHIRHNDSGEVRRYEMRMSLGIDDRRPGVFIWEEGNYGCDCNREIFFEKAKGVEVDLDAATCGEGRYSVNLEYPPGNVYYREYE